MAKIIREKDMDRFPDKINIVQLAETSGFSVFDINDYIQSELDNKPKKYLLLHLSSY